jgi:mono/diheme cytochrome c family protein
MFRVSIAAAAAAALSLAAVSSPAAVKIPDDVAVKLKVSEGSGNAPLAKITVKNQWTSPQNGVTVTVTAEDEAGPVLWSGTVDLAPGKSAVLSQRIWLDEAATVLVARSQPSGGPDMHPADDVARAGLGRPGKPALLLVGRSIHLAHCASCHGQGAAGGSAPSLLGMSSKAIAAKAAAGGTHAFPWLSPADAKDLSLFFKDPSAVVMPPALPAPPPGGWPAYEAGVKALLDSRCISCHGPSLASGGIRLDTLAGARKTASRALVAVKLGRMPQGGKPLAAAEIGLFKDWIDGGMRP